MEKSPRLSRALLLVAVALLIGLGAWLGSSGLNNNAAPPNPALNTSVAIHSTSTAAFIPDRIPTYTTVPTVTETVLQKTYVGMMGKNHLTPEPTFDISFMPTVAPLEDWVTYTDDFDGYTFRYPMGWSLDEPPPNNRRTWPNYSMYIRNLRGDDPTLINLPKGPLPPQLVNMGLIIDKPGSNLLPIPQGENLETWIKRMKSGMADQIETDYIKVGATTAYRVLWQLPQGVDRGISVYILNDDRLFTFYYFLDPRNPGWTRTAEQIVESFQFTR